MRMRLIVSLVDTSAVAENSYFSAVKAALLAQPACKNAQRTSCMQRSHCRTQQCSYSPQRTQPETSAPAGRLPLALCIAQKHQFSSAHQCRLSIARQSRLYNRHVRCTSIPSVHRPSSPFAIEVNALNGKIISWTLMPPFCRSSSLI
jgi:hypothetical protein